MTPIIEINGTSLLVLLGMIVISVSIILVIAKIVLYIIIKKKQTTRNKSMTDFETYLMEQMKDPEFAAEWERLEWLSKS